MTLDELMKRSISGASSAEDEAEAYGKKAAQEAASKVKDDVTLDGATKELESNQQGALSVFAILTKKIHDFVAASAAGGTTP